MNGNALINLAPMHNSIDQLVPYRDGKCEMCGSFKS